MPRPKHIDPPVEFVVSMPKSIFDEMQTKLHSEAVNRVPTGLRSKVIAQLVRNWMANQKGN
jgi:hypothetical protein